jgi:hypothetical protein
MKMYRILNCQPKAIESNRRMSICDPKLDVRCGDRNYVIPETALRTSFWLDEHFDGV